MTLRVLFALALTGMLLDGCGSNFTSPPAASPARVGQPIPSASGGSVALANGDAVTLPAGALATDQRVTLTADSAETPLIPLPGWRAAHGTLTVDFAGGIVATNGAGTIRLTFVFASDAVQPIMAAQAPLLEVTTARGSIERVSPDAAFDGTTHTMTVNVPVAYVAGAVRFKLYAAVDGPRTQTPAFGPRRWSTAPAPAHWVAEPFTVDPAQSTVVMVHGIFSSVETAFGPCEGAILGAGAYGQAVGLDYDWTQPPAAEAPLLAKFINSLPVPTVDIEAHSYGTVVTLAALPLITKKIDHVVLLGGPLPLDGSPQADPGYLRDLVLLGIFVGGYPSDVYRAVASGMIASLATGSASMQSINAGVRALAPLPPFVQVAGAHALPAELSNDFVYAFYLALYGLSNNDGVVEQSSAVTNFGTSTTFVATDLDHIQLECDPGVIGWVGGQVHP